MTLRKAVFLDKDGTLIDDVPYNVDPCLIRLAPGARAGLARLREAGYEFVVITNQAGVALGRFPEDALQSVELRLRKLLEDGGISLAGFYYCPHHPQGSVSSYSIPCSCRKPQPGLLQDAARALEIDLERSWMMGDILHDVEAGNRAGCRTLLLDVGNETEWIPGPFRTPYARASNWTRAVDLILSQESP